MDETKTAEVMAKLMSKKYGREITPEQYKAVEYFVDRQVSVTVTCLEEIRHHLTEHEKAELVSNLRNSYYNQDNLGKLVYTFYMETSDETLGDVTQDLDMMRELIRSRGKEY